MQGTVRKVRMNSKVTFSNGLQHVDMPVLAGQQRLTLISTVQTLDAVKRICQKQRMIRINDERDPMLLVQFDDEFYDI